LQCVAVCCSVLQCVAVCCSVLQCVAVCCSVLHCVALCGKRIAATYYKCDIRVLQCVAVCCSVLQCAALCGKRIAATYYKCDITPMHVQVMQQLNRFNLHVWHCSFIHVSWIIHVCGTISLHPRTEDIRLQTITTAKIQNFKQVFTESLYHSNKFPWDAPKIPRYFHGSKRESPSLKRVDREAVESEVPNILSRISSVSWCITCNMWCIS